MSQQNSISDDDQLPLQSHIVPIKHESSSSGSGSSKNVVQSKCSDDDAAAAAAVLQPVQGLCSYTSSKLVKDPRLRKQDDDEMTKKSPSSFPEDGRERLKRHRIEMSGRVWIPDIWGQEQLLMDWVDSAAFDASLVPNGIVSARSALVQAGRRTNSGGIRI